MKQIVVNCEVNDPVDIKCGGEPVLGYDFFIEDTENTEEYVSFIKEELKANNQPLMEIKVWDVLASKGTIWTKDMIKKCIERGY